MIVLILVDTSDHVVFLELILQSFLQYKIIDWNGCKTDKYASRDLQNFHRVEPGVFLDVCYFVSLFRFCIQNLSDEFSAVA